VTKPEPVSSEDILEFSGKDVPTDGLCRYHGRDHFLSYARF
jgi:hypothetical protein